ncbi:MAG: cytochrome c3 family protein [Acidobacteria bacterium]|nr:cytochrome c3 family protein [Acidobacteriota bacterium]
MRAAEDERRERTGATRTRPRGRLRALTACAFASLLLFVFAAYKRTPASPANVFAAPAVAIEPQGDGASFSHASERHASLGCASCHERPDNSPTPRWPGHKACTDCHVQQFVTQGGQLCLICHANVEGNNPPLKAFPGLSGFNMRFDHARHSEGGARPAEGCASCHRPARRGVALTIPAGAPAHENCYSCHTPQARGSAGDIASCATCHTQGGYRRTPSNARAYSVSFSHATHGARQGMRCDDCHQVRAGAGQGRQVASPQPTQHFGSARAQSCMTCHNNRRAFGGDDFADCKRCHKGQTFRF